MGWGKVPPWICQAVTRDVVIPVRVDPAGRTGPTADQARGPYWRRTSRGRYVPASVDPDPVTQRVVEAAAVLPEDWGGVTGWAALAWCGARWFDGSPWGGGRPAPVSIVVGGNRHIRPQRGIATSEERLLEADQLVVDGVRLTTAPRTACFEMRYAATVRDAVITLDMACFNDVVSIEEVDAYAAGLSGWTGIPRCREGIALADENSWSPREVTMRLVWSIDAGLPRPLCNRPVFAPDGSHLGTPDLLDPVAGVAGEYDGSLHLEGARRAHDLVREHHFRSHGLEYVTMLAGDVREPAAFISRLLAAYDRAADVPMSRRRWTIERPNWWHDTTTVAARRALADSLRERLLRHRVA